MTLKANETLLNGQYQIIRQLGRGGFGFVYLASDTLLGEQVAIKEMIPSLVGDESILKRFLAEAKATMRLTHDRIVRTHNVFSERGNYYIAMEYMAGGSLETRLQRGPLRPEAAVQIAADVCEGLTYAHNRGVVHCDLKPANILFTTNDRAKVADFGIAHVSEQLLTRTWQTPATFVAGTLPYMSPEQADGVRDDSRIDVYALGAVLYRMLTGQTYLEFDQRDTPGAQANNVQLLRSQPVNPPSARNRRTPAWLDTVVLNALAKQPSNRYASTVEFRSALLREGAAVPDTPAQTLPARPAPPGVRRHPGTAHELRARLPRWFWIVAGAAALLLVALTIILAVGLSGGFEVDQPPVVTLVVLPGSSPGVPPDDTPLPLPSPVPTAPPVDTPIPYYYQDDFSDPSSGWDIAQDETWSANYVNGEYRLGVTAENTYVLVRSSLQEQLADYEIVVDARQVEGPVDNNFGLLVRMQPESDDFYWFQISGDGYYRVSLHQADQTVNSVPWTQSELIYQGLGATNRLKVVAEGPHFGFYVNGTHLSDVLNDTFPSGTVGLAVGTFDEPGVVVHFDNFVVRPLTE